MIAALVCLMITVFGLIGILIGLDEHAKRVTLENGMVTIEIPDDISRDLTPEEARDLAAWLNAAANHSEEGNAE